MVFFIWSILKSTVLWTEEKFTKAVLSFSALLLIFLENENFRDISVIFRTEVTFYSQK